MVWFRVRVGVRTGMGTTRYALVFVLAGPMTDASHYLGCSDIAYDRAGLGGSECVGLCK